MTVELYEVECLACGKVAASVVPAQNLDQKCTECGKTNYADTGRRLEVKHPHRES